MPARRPANSQTSRLAVYNTYIPQTGIYEFAAFPQLILRICEKFAIIAQKICRICKTLRKIFQKFLEFQGGAGDPSNPQKRLKNRTFRVPFLVRLIYQLRVPPIKINVYLIILMRRHYRSDFDDNFLLQNYSKSKTKNSKIFAKMFSAILDALQ